MSQPLRGEVCSVDLGIAGKVRPALVVSASISDTDYALVAMIPHTTSEHPSQHHVRLRIAGLKDGSFNVQALAPVPLAKFVRRIATLPADQLRTIDAAVKRWPCLA
jgi:mRNA interferase MazF